MNIVETKFTRFSGGRANDTRSGQANEFGESLNFDIFSQPSLLLPVRDYEADEGYGGSSTGIRASDIACFGTTGGSVYGVGRKNDGTGRKIYNKTISSSTWLGFDASDGSAAEISTGCAVPGFFIRQFNTSGSSLYWFVSGNASTPTTSFWQLGFMDYSTPVAANFAKKTLIFNPTIYPQAILGKDGNVYVSDDNKIHKCANTGTVTDSIFTVSKNYDITSLCLMDSYLAIAIYGQGVSKVLLWDYSSAQASETIEMGEGAVMVLENLGGRLVYVKDRYINSTLFGAGANSSGSMQVGFVGEDAPTKDVRAFGVVAGAIGQYKYVKDGILHWYAKIPQADGSYLEGIWAYGRKTTDRPYALALLRETAGTFEGFWGISDYLYLPHSNDGHVSRTNSEESYTLTSEYETLLINDDDSALDKDSKGVVVSFNAFETGQTIATYYRKDGETSWTTLTPAPDVAVGDLYALYPITFHFKEIEIKTETTGGLKVSGIRLGHERLTNGLN